MHDCVHTLHAPYEHDTHPSLLLFTMFGILLYLYQSARLLGTSCCVDRAFDDRDTSVRVVIETVTESGLVKDEGTTVHRIKDRTHGSAHTRMHTDGRTCTHASHMSTHRRTYMLHGYAHQHSVLHRNPHTWYPVTCSISTRGMCSCRRFLFSG